MKHSQQIKLKTKVLSLCLVESIYNLTKFTRFYKWALSYIWNENSRPKREAENDGKWRKMAEIEEATTSILVLCAVLRLKTPRLL
mgnify:CR=1 FL=1